MDVKITEINKEESMICIEKNGSTQWLPVIPPASIGYAKPGMASISLDREGNGTVTYLKMSNFGQRSPTPNAYPPRNNYPKNNFQQGSSYKPKEEVDWSKIGRGKCKYGFLLEAYKIGKDLKAAEVEAEAWANASIRFTELGLNLAEQRPESEEQFI